MKIIDAHAHLWETQRGMVNGMPVYDIGRGRSMLCGEERQMLPPYMTDGRNTVERLLANMDFALVSGAVITQELMDGNQDEYLAAIRARYPERLRVQSLYEEGAEPRTAGVDGIKICGGRLKEQDLTRHARVFQLAREHGLFVAIDMADGDAQTGSLREMVEQYPDVRVSIGHFGMVTTPGWEEQIKLARHDHVFIESGGITWLFNAEFYPYPSAVRAILTARDLCGMEKLMWGSDYPRTMTAITYRMSWDFLQRTALLTEEEKGLFLYQNAHAFYRFGELPEIPPIRSMAE